jgi:ABC-type lipoprotein export system ATPase subunit/GNAT superfamily N-acetyltransferase
MKTKVNLSTRIEETPRVMQVRGIFDLEAKVRSSHVLEAELPLEEQQWQIGLITGPSGCGKSSLARALWPQDQSILDAFPEGMPIKEIVSLLSSVGFSSPPAWLLPYSSLSTGQQFRASLARVLADAIQQESQLVVFDEFTSVVDRTVAQIGSAALSRTIRRYPKLRFIAVTCHEDIINWLNPDWVFRPNENHFSWRSLQQHRPPIALSVVRCQTQAWQIFAQHHYLSHSLNPSSICFLASWKGIPVAFSSWLPFVGAGPLTRREHRTVVLPDYQGVGLGNHLSALIASMWKGLGYRAISTTTHPAMIRHRNSSPLWRMHRSPSLAGSSEGKLKHATTRLTAGFEYIGPAMDHHYASLLFAQ